MSTTFRTCRKNVYFNIMNIVTWFFSAVKKQLRKIVACLLLEEHVAGSRSSYPRLNHNQDVFFCFSLRAKNLQRRNTAASAISNLHQRLNCKTITLRNSSEITMIKDGLQQTDTMQTPAKKQKKQNKIKYKLANFRISQ